MAVNARPPQTHPGQRSVFKASPLESRCLQWCESLLSARRTVTPLTRGEMPRLLLQAEPPLENCCACLKVCSCSFEETRPPQRRAEAETASTEHALLWNHKEKFTCSYFEGLSKTETFLYNKETLFSDSRQTLHAFNKSEFLPDAGLWRDGSRRRDRGSSRTQSRRQHVHQLLLLGDGGSNPELLAGVLQHGHGQLSQSAVQHVGPQLVFR